MTPNVGTIDRALRLILGLALLVLPFASQMALFANPVMMWGAALVGVVLIATAGMRFCPLYRIIGVKTCQS